MVLGAPGAHGHAISFEEGCTESVFGLPSALSRDGSNLLRTRTEQKFHLLKTDMQNLF